MDLKIRCSHQHNTDLAEIKMRNNTHLQNQATSHIQVSLLELKKQVKLNRERNRHDGQMVQGNIHISNTAHTKFY